MDKTNNLYKHTSTDCVNIKTMQFYFRWKVQIVSSSVIRLLKGNSVSCQCNWAHISSWSRSKVVPDLVEIGHILASKCNGNAFFAKIN